MTISRFCLYFVLNGYFLGRRMNLRYYFSDDELRQFSRHRWPKLIQHRVILPSISNIAPGVYHDDIPRTDIVRQHVFDNNDLVILHTRPMSWWAGQNSLHF